MSTRAISEADDSGTVPPDFNSKVEARLSEVDAERSLRFLIGQTRRGTQIWCIADPDSFDDSSKKARVLIVGGLDGSSASVDAATCLYAQHVKWPREDLVLACVPIANPDGWATGSGPRNLSGGVVNTGYPPEGTAYNTPQSIEAHVLWRFIGWFAPDIVIEVHDETSAKWKAFQAGDRGSKSLWPKDCLANAVRETPVAGIGRCFSQRFVATGKDANVARTGDAPLLPIGECRNLVATGEYVSGGHDDVTADARSLLRLKMSERLNRTPIKVAEQLTRHYGQHLDSVMYQPALALVARLRLGGLNGDDTHRRDVERIIQPYVDGTSDSLGPKASGSHLAGHLIFAELAQMSGDATMTDLVRKAASVGFDDDGNPLAAMPYHNEMSDAVFMACPILITAGRLTGEDRYFEMAEKHLLFMQAKCLRADGLYRHSPLDEAAWGRGNGFPALGLALCLADLAKIEQPSEAARNVQQLMQDSLVHHLRALARYQDVTGMWQQVIDDPGSYRELTSSCMIVYAMARGIRSGWLDEEEFAPIARRAWEAIKGRIGDDGVLLDVCTGTGKQKSLWDYRDRTAILGRDERGGAMALMAASEIAAWQAATAATEHPPE